MYIMRHAVIIMFLQLAYTSAKEITCKTFIDNLDKALYQMQASGVDSPLPQSNRVIRHCMQILDSFHKDQNITEDSVQVITQVVIIHTCFS